VNLLPVILSGGSGTRLWPLSREQYPKQLLPLVGEFSLLQDTVNRVRGMTLGGTEVTAPLVVCNERHRFLVAEQLRQLQLNPSAILLEPCGRNTAPALTLAALHDLAKPGNGEASILLVMPADHVIKNQKAFQKAVVAGFELAADEALVTFGIVPDSVQTGYGYIHQGQPVHQCDANAYFIEQFVEKPDEKTARSYVDSGEYLWNSGMFMMKSRLWLEQMAQFRPDMLQACEVAYKNGVKDLDFFRVATAEFQACPSDSIDYAVMEPLTQTTQSSTSELRNRGVVIPLDADWSDVGVWSAMWQVQQQDSNSNVLKGDVICHEVQGSYIHSQSRLVAGVGLTDLIIVETEDAVLVAHKGCTQDVKQVVETLQQQDRSERITHRQVYRPWGFYQGVVEGERFQVKKIEVKPGASLSLQMHHHRAEHWIVVKGTAKVTRGDESFLLSENESTYIPLGVKHRLENPGTLPLQIIEVQSGSYLGEDDIVRFEDVYGRE